MKNLLYLLSLATSLLLFVSCQTSPQSTVADNDDPGKYIRAKKATILPKIDGEAYDKCWKQTEWLPLEQRWLGEPWTEEDFKGDYKVCWGEDFIYVLTRITDDVFMDKEPDGLKTYWDDDCLEIFIDEDHSGGNHQYSHNAFAYHIAKDYRVADIGPDSLPHYYNDHIITIRRRRSNTYTWESAIAIYKDDYKEGSSDNSPIKLSAGKKLGFALAYCDNDYSEQRENFIGSVVVEGENKNRGWIDANIFGTLELVEK
ncbi:MAG: sugar-binding protein [Bacteroidota bacterium]